MPDAKGAIIEIEQSVGDLTDSTVLLRSKQFLSFRKSITETNAAEIVHLIQSKMLIGDLALIGIEAIEVLPEERYWTITMPLLSANTDQNILGRVLMPPLPYGPGYAHSITNDMCRVKLGALKKNPQINAQLKDLISFILDGEAAKTYSRFKQNPMQFNYPREFLEPKK